MLESQFREQRFGNEGRKREVGKSDDSIDMGITELPLHLLKRRVRRHRRRRCWTSFRPLPSLLVLRRSTRTSAPSIQSVRRWPSAWCAWGSLGYKKTDRHKSRIRLGFSPPLITCDHTCDLRERQQTQVLSITETSARSSVIAKQSHNLTHRLRGHIRSALYGVSRTLYRT